MRKLIIVFFFTLYAAGFSNAQVSPQITGSGAPANPCVNGGQQYLDTTNHILYLCPSNGSNWVNIALGNLQSAGTITAASGAPANTACQGAQTYVDTTAGAFYVCKANVLTSVGGGSGTVTNIATTAPITGGPITTTGTIALSAFLNNAQTATYQVLAADFSSYKTITVASGTFTITLVASGSQPANGQYINIINYGSGVVTIARSGQNINGGTTSLTLPAATATNPTGAVCFSDGTNYECNLLGANAISSFAAAITSNTIANGNFPQTWNCAETTDAQDCMQFGETSASTNGTLTNGLANQAVAALVTATNSTATPLEVAQGSITNTVATPAAQVEATWNNAGLSGKGLLISVTETADAAGSNYVQVNGGAAGTTNEFSVGKGGAVTAATSLASGTAPGWTAGTAGFFALGAGTAPTGAATSSGIYASSANNCAEAIFNTTDEGCLLASKTINATNLINGITNFNQAAQSQVVVSGTEYYITKSDLDMPAVYTTAITTGTTMRWRIALTKTAAGTGTFQINLKKGINGTIGDSTLVTVTIGTQTAAADNMECDVQLTFTSVTAAYWTVIPHQAAASATGFGLVYPATAAQFTGTLSGLTTTTGSDKYGLSLIFTTGTPTFVVNYVSGQAFGVN